MSQLNLNREEIQTDGSEGKRLQDFSCGSGNVQAFFKNLAENVIPKIADADMVVGCMAWLTCPKILGALEKHQHVSILIQKEDWLRPDSGDYTKEKLRKSYSRLRCGVERDTMPKPICDLSYAGDLSIDPIRCVGYVNTKKAAAVPRSHHKFLVFCHFVKVCQRGSNCEGPYCDYYHRMRLQPYAVWTGSFNMTYNASNSFENAVYIEDSQIAQAYLNEYAQLFALSEPLNWESEWVMPEYREGS